MGVILKRVWISLVIIVVLISEANLWCNGCNEDEKIALLKLRDYLNYPNGKAMSSWDKIPNCCFWDPVGCEFQTSGRVTSLSLWRDVSLGDWYLNTSFFLPFKKLQDLSLEEINILGCVQNEGFERLSSLANLESLTLDGNQFNNTIFPSLATLSSLKSLSLQNNRLKGTINIQELSNLTNLEELNLQGNEIEGFEFPHGLRNVEIVDLSHNHINNTMLSSLEGFSSLSSLNIGYNPFKGTFNMKELDGLSKLEELDLSGNQIIKFQGLKDTRGLSKLSKLTLDEMNNTIGGNSSLIQSLGGAFPYLKVLSLRNNDFKGKIFDQELESLEELVLDSSNLSEMSLQSLGALPSLKFLSLCSLPNNLSTQELPFFKNLEVLHLNSTSSDGIFQELGGIAKITSLKAFSISSSGLTGTIPVNSGICNLKHLQVLDMSFNNLGGTLPWCLANMTSLRILDVSFNSFTGKIYPLGGLTSIQELTLSENHFEIPISLAPFFNHSKLVCFDGSKNEVYSEREVHSSIPKFQLETLRLSGQGYGGAFPEFLYYQHNLKEVDLSHIKMEGGFPFWLLENNTGLEKLYLANNSLSGSFHLPISPPHASLIELDISNNGFRGQLPPDIGAVLPMLQILKMSRNDFSGCIPNSFSNTSSLQTLQLDGNQFTGDIPSSLSNCTYLDLVDISDNNLSGSIPGWMGNLHFLKVLDLSRNSISGNLPSNFNPPQLIHIYLSENRIQGTISNAFYHCLDLITLDLQRNSLIGTIPKWIGRRLSWLGHLSLSYNNFEGEIPNQFCNLEYLKLIDLSHNHLSGHIPPCLKLTEGSGIMFPGADPLAFDFTTKRMTYSFEENILGLFYGIDLSDNILIGEIPPEMGNLEQIKVLNLSHNSLTGQIPSTFSNLTEIESLDLSYNKLNGKIPSQLAELHFLAVFSVAYNNLSGKTPDRVAQFATFDNSSFEGNALLCGLPLSRTCGAPSILRDSIDEKKEENGFIDMDDFVVSFFTGYMVVLFTIAAVLCINPQWRNAWFWYIQVIINNCQYFVEDNIFVFFKSRHS